MYYTAQNATLLTTSKTLINKVNIFIVIMCSYSHLLAEGKLCGQDRMEFFFFLNYFNRHCHMFTSEMQS